MNAVMLPIQPRHCENICTVVGEENGKPVYKKTVEVRKKVPKQQTPFKCYIYCTKDMHYKLAQIRFADGWRVKHITDDTTYANGCTCNIGDTLNGKVIGEFVCDRIDTYYYGNMDYPTPAFDGDESVCEIGDGYYITSGELEKTCLPYEELEKYGNGKTLYGWHISDLQVYYTPKELGEFNGFKKCAACKVSGYEVSACIHDENCMIPVPLTRPPQSWCYVEELSE